MSDYIDYFGDEATVRQLYKVGRYSDLERAWGSGFTALHKAKAAWRSSGWMLDGVWRRRIILLQSTVIKLTQRDTG